MRDCRPLTRIFEVRPADATVPATPATGDQPREHRALFFFALALALIPLVVAAVAVFVHGSGAFISDRALMELRVRDVGRHSVLLGLYSRDGWSHPGPLIFYTLALPYRLSGSNPQGMLVGALAINAAAIAGMALVARRLGGMPAALLTLVGCGIVAHSMGAQMLMDPWVCFVTVLPFGLFCYLAWGMTEGRAWMLPGAACLATWLTQTHVGFAPVTAPALLVGAVWLWIAARRSGDADRRRTVLRAGAVSVLLLGLLWLPTLWDQLFGIGNLGSLVKWFVNEDRQPHTFPEGLRVVLGQFAAVPDWITGTRRIGFNGETTLLTETLWPALLLPFVVAVVVAWRRRDARVLRLAGVTTFITATAVVAVARTQGIMYEYRLLWIWLLAMLATVVIVWTVWNVVAATWPQVEARALVPIALVGLLALGIAQIVDVVQSGTTDNYSAATLKVARSLTEQLHGKPGDVVLRSETPIGEFYRQGLVLALERRGIAARVPADPTDTYGSHRVASRRPAAAQLVVLANDDLDSYIANPNLRLVAYSGPVPFERRIAIGARMTAERAQLLAQLNAKQITPAEFGRKFRALVSPDPTVAVFESGGAG